MKSLKIVLAIAIVVAIGVHCPARADELTKGWETVYRQVQGDSERPAWLSIEEAEAWLGNHRIEVATVVKRTLEQAVDNSWASMLPIIARLEDPQVNVLLASRLNRVLDDAGGKPVGRSSIESLMLSLGLRALAADRSELAKPLVLRVFDAGEPPYELAEACADALARIGDEASIARLASIRERRESESLDRHCRQAEACIRARLSGRDPFTHAGADVAAALRRFREALRAQDGERIRRCLSESFLALVQQRGGGSEKFFGLPELRHLADELATKEDWRIRLPDSGIRVEVSDIKSAEMELQFVEGQWVISSIMLKPAGP